MKNVILFVPLVFVLGLCMAVVLTCAFFMAIGGLFEWIAKITMKFGDTVMANYEARI
ncbi:MAG: hypothetical protein WC356_02880 [Candidatus Micrarchaeia archaeon]|jgi:hypothetical protein